MENFEYHTPTRLIFGKGIIDRLPEVMRPIGNKVLLAYGGGSIKRLGLYDKVKELLKDFEIHELAIFTNINRHICIKISNIFVAGTHRTLPLFQIIITPSNIVIRFVNMNCKH